MFDVFAFVAIITPPQAASLAVGSVRRVPVVREDSELGSGQQGFASGTIDATESLEAAGV
jgi:pyruvate/2-oxoglutarate dehydrogenase complex dihydrolipoamide acyltransferase (E2) component